ncbi:Transcriptional regulatory protein SrrA [Nocardioides dokdonensis FR1436]|uniref:Transcriptional regulatory protein SrrA n=1 Tax=Nocardioides dokdonensis FR1436 TaxID=1300347 RepID=A0A1A9GMC7_9ACTN|nr:response regulator [Nocardioides dokdonensis]ANH38641.1 Transcriptional regulatory protein SrrA [Nocardioides dokdonensis FR1436]
MPTVLIVDDDDDVRMVTSLSLSRVGGWDVLEASRGREAIDLARAAQPDAILLDLMMPEMDGITAFGLLQEDAATRHIPVILLTAKSRVGATQPWDGLAVAGVLAKPFSPMQLPGDVAALLGWETT